MLRITFTLPLLFVCCLSFAQTNEELAAELELYIEQQMSNQNIPGLSACIVKEGQVVWKQAFGLAHIANNQPVTLETEFTLASISKLFTATACAQLWEDGILDIDADINDYLPIEIINPNFPEVPITTRQLLLHKSSLIDSEADLQLWDELGDPIFDLPTFCADFFVEGGQHFLADNWGNSAPGESNYWYTNAGYTLLGYIVQEASGMPFNEYCQQSILDPLGMEQAGWFYSEVDASDVAMPYSNTLQPLGYYSVPYYPAAMLKSNVEELAQFLIAYTQGGTIDGFALLEPSTFAEVVPEDMTNGFAWWGTDTWWGDQSGDYWSHGGYMNGVRTQLNYYPDNATGLIILTNGEGNYLSIQNEIESYISQFSVEVESVDEVWGKMELVVYPNPVNDDLQISGLDTAQQYNIKIVDIMGQVIMDELLENSQLEVTNLAQGVYTLIVSSNRKSVRRSFVKG